MGKNDEKKQEMKLVSEETALGFCAGLTDSGRRVVAMCIDGELGSSSTRAGSVVWERARILAASKILNNEMDLDEMAGEMLPYLDEVSGDEATDTGRRALKARVDGYKNYLQEEAQKSEEIEENPTLAVELAGAGV